MAAWRGGGVGRGVWRWLAAVVLVGGVVGCFLRDPLDPRGELGHQVAGNFADVERTARSREAFERARQRVGRVQKGMTIAEAETTLEATVVTERRGDEKKDDEAPRQKFIDGLLCRTNPSPLRQRWLFGYDEGGVELVGFVLELERDDPEKEKWTVRSIDRNPSDDCPDASE